MFPFSPAIPLSFLFNVSLFSFYSYLHGCETPIVHGNLSCDTIFIQHNGLIKIGSGNQGFGANQGLSSELFVFCLASM